MDTGQEPGKAGTCMTCDLVQIEQQATGQHTHIAPYMKENRSVHFSMYKDVYFKLQKIKLTAYDFILGGGTRRAPSPNWTRKPDAPSEIQEQLLQGHT